MNWRPWASASKMAPTAPAGASNTAAEPGATRGVMNSKAGRIVTSVTLCGMLAQPFITPAMIEFGHGTHPGLKRKVNEDTYYADPALGLFLVADGMGGHAQGKRAAALARDCVVANVGRGESRAAAVSDAGRCHLHNTDARHRQC